jgi:hypothetical protein
MPEKNRATESPQKPKLLSKKVPVNPSKVEKQAFETQNLIRTQPKMYASVIGQQIANFRGDKKLLKRHGKTDL